jgi:hypothetical protein
MVATTTMRAVVGVEVAVVVVVDRKEITVAVDLNQVSTAKCVARRDTLPTSASIGMIFPIKEAKAANRRLLLLRRAPTTSTRHQLVHGH